ncbi:LuxR C-terminal-related transcriptional regulator [Marivirga sp.]|uniref:LuxR C-terminal-related transcriptional regulator n=1 Tax=Marivirga sp. TaxID=2018662 RepID=UPI002D7E2875|nr:LuxR C-terminal-related transcriptional regulator [Marivirga sp.]HET8859589.1 LuxR C-terminal-related transcriptional regulator [Marivirga sp.]
MKAEKDELFSIYKPFKNYLAKNSVAIDQVKLDRLSANIFCPGQFYYYVIDSPTLSFEFVSPTVEDILGVPANELTMENLIERLHPDDMDFFIKAEHLVADFLQNRIRSSQIPDYKISYCLRERTNSGEYKTMLLQTLTLQCTEEGALLKVLGVHTDISHITKVNNYKLSLIGLNGEPSFLELDVMAPNPWEMTAEKSILTKREIEIIKLTAEGLTSKEIADRLFVANETINSHKKNAMSKMGFKNTYKLISYCIRKGLI